MVTPRAETAETLRPARPLRLRTYTCLDCGHRSATWAAFRDHRRRCKGSSPTDPPAVGRDGDQPEPPPDDA